MDATLEYAGEKVTFYDVLQTDYIGKLLLSGKWYELPNLEFIRSLNVRGTYVDAGAYIGTYSVFLSLFCPSDKVVSFEPQLKAFQRLSRNLVRNGAINAQPMNMGLSDHMCRGQARGGDVNGGGAWLVPGDEVDVVTLDSLGLEDVTLMKVDVEGMELKVLKGAEQTLQRSVQHLFVETWTEWQSTHLHKVDYKLDKMTEFLKPLKFELVKELAENVFYYQKVK